MQFWLAMKYLMHSYYTELAIEYKVMLSIAVLDSHVQLAKM